MTADEPAPPTALTGRSIPISQRSDLAFVPSKPAGGCTSCGSVDTVTVDGVHGRRCATCPPQFSPTHLEGLAADRRSVGAYVRSLPPGPFRPDFAGDLVAMGRVDAAFAYLGFYLRREIGERFDRASDAIGVAW
ncbi:hypothetical protein [Blastococcus sp. CT_GayMR16]|uniref:hypothetical protein n=1 Tax=Blastococcus sp. CT_GayMR16 TaxID=2559607 RepID=UPI00107302C0|nr:hypothetical protein [Blastococcus sp. CT_GayMR16]TFV90423.1 hypothetical protein E4P38_03000 [Blastococcus sp. CT_GayMR16]